MLVIAIGPVPTHFSYFIGNLINIIGTKYRVQLKKCTWLEIEKCVFFFAKPAHPCLMRHRLFFLCLYKIDWFLFIGKSCGKLICQVEKNSLFIRSKYNLCNRYVYVFGTPIQLDWFRWFLDSRINGEIIVWKSTRVIW